MEHGGYIGVLFLGWCLGSMGCATHTAQVSSPARPSGEAPCPAPSSPTPTPHTAAATALREQTPAPLAFPGFTLARTLVRDLDSELTGKQHQLLIRVPDSFQQEPARRYPVLIVLDGQWDFALVDSLAGGLRYDQVTPEMLIVGLSYAGKSPDYGALRSHDYLPTRARDRKGSELGGGAANFLAWIESTVLPLLEKDYRADPERRILAGSSYGGLFVLNALFEKPELFWAYVSISPAVGWDDRYIFRREQQFRATHPSLDRRVWLSSGAREWPDYLREERAFFKQFSASGYRGLVLAVHEIEGERHAGVKPEAYNRALRFVSEPLVPKPR